MNHLLIGGTNDGKRVKIPIAWHLWQMKCTSNNPDDAPQFVPTEIYERRFLRGNNREFEVFAIQGMTGDELIIQLIAGYKK